MGNTIHKLPKQSQDRPPPRPPKPGHLSGPRYNQNPLDISDSATHPDSQPSPDDSPPDFLQTLTEKAEGIYSTVGKSDLASESMTITELIEEYGSHLPLIFSVSESLYGIVEDNSLLEQQLLSIHFQKMTKIIDVEASWGAKYMIPINSMFECSPLYNPEGKLESAKRGYEFETAGDLMKVKTLPLMVFVDKTDHTGLLPEARIREGDILVLKQVVFDSQRQKRLECIDFKSKSPKLLSESCNGQFTTRTSSLRFTISDIEPYFTFPMSAIFYSPADESFQLPLYATVGCYTITNCRNIDSVIASTFYKRDDGTAIVDLMEILLEVPIEVQLVKLSESELEQLQEQTKPLFDTFHPSCLSKVITDQNSSTNYIQTQLFKVIPRDDRWKVGVKMHTPHQPSLRPPTDDDDDDDYERMDAFSTVSASSSSLPVSTTPSSPGPLPLAISHSMDAVCRHREKYPSPTQPRKSPSRNTADYSGATMVSRSLESDDPIPYMTAKAKEGRLEHSVPYDYVKFTSDRQAQIDKLMREKMKSMGQENKETSSNSKI